MTELANSPIVHVIDDDPEVRDSTAFLLGTANLVARTYASAKEFLAAITSERTGCVITDVRMPEIDGLTLLARLKTANGRLPVIVITGHGDVPLAVEAMKLGAFDFIEKPFDDERLLGAVRHALDVSEKGSIDGQRDQEIAARLATLSAREHQVLQGLVAGHPNKTIAYDLAISPRTVEVYRAHVMTKMQARSLSELVRMTIKAG